MSKIESLRASIAADADNHAATRAGRRPLFVAAEPARIVLVGQASGRAAQEPEIPWNDASGHILWEWLGVDEPEFRDPDLFAILPMEFYYPHKS